MVARSSTQEQQGRCPRHLHQPTSSPARPQRAAALPQTAPPRHIHPAPPATATHGRGAQALPAGTLDPHKTSKTNKKGGNGPRSLRAALEVGGALAPHADQLDLDAQGSQLPVARLGLLDHKAAGRAGGAGNPAAGVELTGIRQLQLFAATSHRCRCRRMAACGGGPHRGAGGRPAAAAHAAAPHRPQSPHGRDPQKKKERMARRQLGRCASPQGPAAPSRPGEGGLGGIQPWPRCATPSQWPPPLPVLLLLRASGHAVRAPAASLAATEPATQPSPARGGAAQPLSACSSAPPPSRGGATATAAAPPPP